METNEEKMEFKSASCIDQLFDFIVTNNGYVKRLGKSKNGKRIIIGRQTMNQNNNFSVRISTDGNGVAFSPFSQIDGMEGAKWNDM